MSYQLFTELVIFIGLLLFAVIPKERSIMMLKIYEELANFLFFVIQPLFYLNGDVNFRNRVKIKDYGKLWKKNCFKQIQKLSQCHNSAMVKKVSLPRGTVWNLPMFLLFWCLTKGLNDMFYSKYNLIVWNLQMVRYFHALTNVPLKASKILYVCISSLNLEIDVIIFVYVNCVFKV